MARPGAGPGAVTADVAGAPAPAELDDMMALAVGLARAAATHHAGRRLGVVASKSSATDPVSEVDRASEAAIVAGLDEHRPHDAILGEEGSGRAGSTGFRWVIDPLDGTVNYLRGLPCHAVAIGVEWQEEPVIGVVYDTGSDEMFTARLGGGAHRNGTAIEVSAADDLSRVIMGTGFPYAADQRVVQAGIIASLIDQIADIRRSGSCAIDLCWTACGRLDAFYEVGPMPWDVTAGLVIVAEAGGVARYDPARRRIMAAGSVLWPQLVDLVEEAERQSGAP